MDYKNLEEILHLEIVIAGSLLNHVSIQLQNCSTPNRCPRTSEVCQGVYSQLRCKMQTSWHIFWFALKTFVILYLFIYVKSWNYLNRANISWSSLRDSIMQHFLFNKLLMVFTLVRAVIKCLTTRAEPDRVIQTEWTDSIAWHYARGLPQFELCVCGHLGWCFFETFSYKMNYALKKWRAETGSLSYYKFTCALLKTTENNWEPLPSLPNCFSWQLL